MIIKEALLQGRSKLKDTNYETPGLVAGVLLAFILNCDRSRLITHDDKELSPEQQALFFNYIERAGAGEPVSYITGNKQFCSYDFKVGRGVLVPRPETELLVEAVVEKVCEQYPPGSCLRVLDLCTGSGCIVISIVRMLQARGYGCSAVGVDISEVALGYAAANSHLNGTDEYIELLNLDILKPEDNGLCDRTGLNSFDIIVSNPPYIETPVIQSLEVNVRDYEPCIALDGGTDGLVFYRRILQISGCLLKKEGWLFFETGYNQADAVKNMMFRHFSNINVNKDYSGIDRIVFGMLY